MKKKIIVYENYKNKDVLLPSMPSISIRLDLDSFNMKEIMKKSSAEKIDGNLFDVLIGQELICRWKKLSPNVEKISPYPSNYIKFIEERRREVKLFYIGCLTNSSKVSYISHIILVSDNGSSDFEDKVLLMINTQENKIKSMVKISAHYNSSYVVFEYWTEKEGDLFIAKETEISDDIEYTEEAIKELGKSGNEPKSIIYYSKYCIDNHGYVNIVH
ncbi:MAG: hypothetical protein PHS30_06815 [Bacteroidales bacterium]|nr:hypothetical protein [Bacteroidales bacterium]